MILKTGAFFRSILKEMNPTQRRVFHPSRGAGQRLGLGDVRVCTHSHTHVRTLTHPHTRVHTGTHTCARAHTLTPSHTCAHRHTHVRTHAQQARTTRAATLCRPLRGTRCALAGGRAVAARLACARCQGREAGGTGSRLRDEAACTGGRRGGRTRGDAGARPALSPSDAGTGS